MYNRTSRSINPEQEEEIASIEAQYEFVNKVLKWNIVDLEKFISTLKARIVAEEAYTTALGKITKNSTAAPSNVPTVNNSSNTSLTTTATHHSGSTTPIVPQYFGDCSSLFETATGNYEASIEKKLQARREFLRCLRQQTELLIKTKDKHEQKRKAVKSVLHEKNTNYLNYRTRDIQKLHKAYFHKCAEYLSLQQQVLISSHDERNSIPESDESLRRSTESSRTFESLSTSPHKRNGMSGLITQMRSQLANAAAAGDPSKLTTRLTRLKKEVYDADQEYRQGIRTLESLRKTQVDTASHAVRHVEAYLLGKSDAVKQAMIAISNQEQHMLANESSLVQTTLNEFEQMDSQQDLDRFLTEYEKLGFCKPRTMCYENYYYGRCKDLLFGCRLSDYAKEHQRTVPLVVTQCIQQVEALGGLEKEGIYRISGRQTNIDLLKSEFEKDESCVGLVDSKYDMFTIGSVLKQFLRELKEPLLNMSPNERLDYAKAEGDQERRALLEKLIERLTEEERDTLKALVIHLAKIEARSKVNKMTLKNLALIFTPAIFHDQNQSDTSQESYAQKVLEDLVKHHDSLMSVIVSKKSSQ
ncbi:Rho GTPase activation protein [Sporodiniella umbellata]|nr:Rho GTPase activation protein [Sporodiniella umbellata]